VSARVRAAMGLWNVDAVESFFVMIGNKELDWQRIQYSQMVHAPPADTD
jgi:hypothetical protein